MPVSVFNDPKSQVRKRSRRVQGKMRQNTIREFGGGWNVIDAPVGLSTRFASILENFYRKQDGSQAIRYGTEFKADISLDSVVRYPTGTAQIANANARSYGDAVANAKNIGFKFRCTKSCSSFDAWIEVVAVTAGANTVAKLYTNVAGSPGALLYTGSTVNITTTGFKQFVFTSAAIVSGTDYWLILSDTGGSGNMTVRTCANQGGNYASGEHDTITSIADNQLTSSEDWKVLINQYGVITGTDIINHRYFNGAIVNVTNAGEVIGTDASWNVDSFFDSGYAQTLTGAPNGWSTSLDFVSFTEIKGSLVICNGVDKPLEVTDTFTARYLQDLATGSNVNTPIGKFCTTVGDYLCIAGVSGEESVVYIGSKGTVGVFPGDAAPNDSVALDLGAFAPEDSAEIRGISSFRSYLFVHFLSATLKVVLGEYDANGNHVPRVDDTLQKFGLTSHRSAVPIVNDLLFGDISGVNTVRRNILSGEVEPDRLSELIAPAYQNQVATLTQDEMLTSIFAVHDRLAGHYMLFIPTGNDNEVRCFVLTFDGKMRIKAWSEFTGWTWRAATSSALGRVFFAKDTRIYQYGNEAFNEEFSADFIGEYDAAWGNNTVYVAGDRILDSDTDVVYICLVGHTSAGAGTFATDRAARTTLWSEYEGEDIAFDWELPWTDAGTRARLKRLAFLSFDTQGTSQFNVDIYVDNVYKDADNNYDPALTLDYTGGDSPGYGGGDQPYGGGRRTTDERLWSHPVKFKILKTRIHGSSKKPLRVISMTQLFAEGRFGR